MTTASALDFHGQRALVTGGSRGIGATIARRLASCGAHVLINYSRNDDAARATCDAITSEGGTAELAKANLVNVEAIRDLMTRVGDSGGLDILVHCAALGSFKPTIDLKPAQYDLTMAINARAFLVCAQEAIPLMQGRDGRIIGLSSLGSDRVVPSYGAIGVSKAALESLTRYLAYELAPKGIRVNAVAAGLVEGTSVERHPRFAEIREMARQRTPAGRLARSDDVADAVLFLCSPLSSFIVGHTLVVDGGMSLVL